MDYLIVKCFLVKVLEDGGGKIVVDGETYIIKDAIEEGNNINIICNNNNFSFDKNIIKNVYEFNKGKIITFNYKDKLILLKLI